MAQNTIEYSGSLAHTHALFEAFHQRFDRLTPAIDEVTEPVTPRGVADILSRGLGIRQDWVPQPAVTVARQRHEEGFDLHYLIATTWPRVSATALLYVPQTASAERPAPLVLVCCGHGRNGKHNSGYQQMARRLIRSGAIVLCPDNLGQGERTPMGHSDCVGPFVAGLSVQGLIVMETLGWLNWARRQPNIDPTRMAAIGNSGGGTLTLMLIPFAQDLAAIASTGYPSSFRFIARKEKKHCHCNILPGIARQLEMHHIYGCFAPRPLLLAQGTGDHLFPQDLFNINARRVRRVYEQAGAADCFEAHLTPGAHAWDTARMTLIHAFLARHLALTDAGGGGGADETTPSLLSPDDTCFASWPHEALTTDQLAAQLTGRTIAPNLKLWDVFPVAEHLSAPLPAVTARGDSRQVLAQYRAFLDGHVAEQAERVPQPDAAATTRAAPLPAWWRSGRSAIEAALHGPWARVQVRELTRSAGLRPVYVACHGDPEPHLRGTANYNSALGARQPEAFRDRPRRTRPVLMVLAGVHGHEVEGMIAAMSLLQLSETGRTLDGKARPALARAIEQLRLIVVPLANPDGRARVPYDGFVGLIEREMHRVGQGTRRDGSLYGWPGCKAVHPMTGDVGVLGAYYDDAGINIMHDEFFDPMSPVTAALLRLIRQEAPDMLLNLHSCGLPPSVHNTHYVPRGVKERILQLTRRYFEQLQQQALPHHSRLPEFEEDGVKAGPPPSFNFNSAAYHAGAAIPFTFESAHGLIDGAAPAGFGYEQILESHHVLFEVAAQQLLERPAADDSAA